MTTKNVACTLGQQPPEGWPIAILFIGAVIVLVAAFLYEDYLRFILGVLALIFVLIAVASKYKIGPFRTLLVDMFSPVYVAMATFTFYFYIFLSTDSDVDPASIVYVAASTCVALILITILWSSVKPRPKRTVAPIFWAVRDGTTRYIFSQLIGWVSFLLIAWMAGYRSITDIFSNPMALRNFDSNNGITYIKLFADFLVFIPIYAQTIKCASKGCSTLLFYILVSSGTLYAFGSGSRGELVFIFVDIVLIRHFYGIRLKIRTALLLSSFLIPFVAVYGVYRSTQNATGMDIANMIDIANRLGPQKIISGFFSRFDAPRYFNLLMTNRDSIDLHPQFGLPYLEIPLLAVPRSLWPDKPALINTQLTTLLVPDANNSTFDFSIFGETYFNFLNAGFIVSGVFIALTILILQLIYQRMFPLGIIVGGLIPVVRDACMAIFQCWIAIKLFFRKSNVDA
jgi:hypothetical protein